ncbi:MAG TPA: neutral zinc metallopeptidase [Thermoleophilaceae bacterium]|nr:neutral zinc metallopeptidase [Thermoleophilaceae bacterium]
MAGSKRIALVLVLALAASVAGCGDGDDEPKSAKKVETTEGKVKAPVPVALAGSTKPADPDAGEKVDFVKSPAKLRGPARQGASDLDVRPAPQRLAAKRNPQTALPTAEQAYEEFIQWVIPQINAFWVRETGRVSSGARYSPPGSLLSYDGNNAPGCFGDVSEDMSGNAYYCPSLLAAQSCQLVASNRRFCVGGDVVAWDRAGLMFPFFREIGGLAAALVLAHEWGHLAQARVFPEFAYTTTIRNELQADCYSGSWAREMKRKGYLDIGDFNQTLELFERAGGAGDAWLDPDSHGNQFQRIRSFTQGFEQGSKGCISPRFDSMLRRVGLDPEA